MTALRDLQTAWTRAGDASRAGLLRAIYARVLVDVDGVREVELTPEVYRHGLALALPEVMSVARPAGVGDVLTTIPIVGPREMESEPQSA